MCTYSEFVFAYIYTDDDWVSEPSREGLNTVLEVGEGGHSSNKSLPEYALKNVLCYLYHF